MRRFGGFDGLEDTVREMGVRDACPTQSHADVMFAARIRNPIEQFLDKALDNVLLSITLGDGSASVLDEDDDDERIAY